MVLALDKGWQLVEVQHGLFIAHAPSLGVQETQVVTPVTIRGSKIPRHTVVLLPVPQAVVPAGAAIHCAQGFLSGLAQQQAAQGHPQAQLCGPNTEALRVHSARQGRWGKVRAVAALLQGRACITLQHALWVVHETVLYNCVWFVCR